MKISSLLKQIKSSNSDQEEAPLGSPFSREELNEMEQNALLLVSLSSSGTPRPIPPLSANRKPAPSVLADEAFNPVLFAYPFPQFFPQPAPPPPYLPLPKPDPFPNTETGFPVLPHVRYPLDQAQPVTISTKLGNNGDHQHVCNIQEFTPEELKDTKWNAQAVIAKSITKKHKKERNKRRLRTTPEQLKILEEIYLYEKIPSLSLREELSVKLGMTPRRIQVWFQNKRAKERRSSKEKSSPPSTPVSSSSSASSGLHPAGNMGLLTGESINNSIGSENESNSQE
jgi:hypothetical protein